MQSSHVARRILAVAAVSALPSVVLAAPQFTDPSAGGRGGSDQQYQHQRQSSVGPAAGSYWSGPSGLAGPEAVKNWVNPSVRDRQFIAYAHPLLPAAPAATDATNYPNWTDTALWGGAFPTGGDQVNFLPDLTETGNDENFGSSVTLNTDVTLSEVNWSGSPGADILSFDLDYGTGNPRRTISTPAGGRLLLDSSGAYSFEAPGGQNVLASTFLIQTIQAPIVGSGSVEVRGQSTIGLSPGNTFNGGLFVRNGNLALWGVATSLGNLAGQGTIDDSSLGNGTVVLENGQIGIVDIRAAPISPNISRNILINGGNNAIRSNVETIYSGNISGFGTLEMGKSLFAHSFRFTTESTFGAGAQTGVIRTIAGTTTVSGAGGRLSGVDQIIVAGGGAANTALIVGDSAFGPLDRINDAAELKFAGARAQFISGNAPTTESVATTRLSSGLSSFALTSGSTGSITYNGGTLVRDNRATAYFAGRQLGSGVATASSAVVFSNGAAQAIGGGGAAGTTNQSIIPYAYGNNTGTTPEANIGSGVASLVTYGANGVTPLNLTTEYVQGFGGAAADSNVNLTSATGNAAGAQTINALRLGSSTNNATTGFAATVTGGPITITSGAVLSVSHPLTLGAAGPVVSAQLNFGSAEAVINAVGASAGPGAATAAGNNGLTLAGNITGTNGLTKSGTATVFMVGAKQFSGPVNIQQGRLVIGENVLPNVAGPLGNSNDPIIINSPSNNLAAGGSNQARFLNENAPGLPVTIGRPVEVRGEGSSGVLVGGFGAAAAGGVPRTIFSGSFTMNSPAYVGVAATGDVEFTGTVSGPGVISDNIQAIGGSLRFTQNNSGWTGGLQVGGLSLTQAGLLVGEADNAFGVGPLATGGQQVIRAVGPGQRVFANSIDLDPAGTGAIGFDGNMKFLGDVQFSGIEFATDVNSTFTVNGGFAINGNTNLELAGVLKYGAFQTVNQSVFGGTATGSVSLLDGSIAGGTVTLSNNNNQMDQRVHIGAAGHGTVNNGTQTANGVPGLSGGTVRLTANGALGNAGVQVQWDNSMLSLVGVTTGDNGFFTRPGTGVGGKGSLHGESGSSVWGGNYTMIGAEGDGDPGVTVITAPGTSAFVSSVGAAAGATLRIAGDIADYTGTGTGLNDGTTAIETANNQVFTKVGAGNVLAKRLIDVNTFGDVTGVSSLTILHARGAVSTLAGIDVRAGALAVTGGGANNEAGRLSATRSLTVASGAKLDLNNQSMVVDYTGSSPRAALEALVDSGRGTGAWDGNGITSGAAAVAPNNFALGIAELTETVYSGTYQSLPVDTDAVIIRYTRAGDADLSGTTDIDDFGRLAANFNTPGRWATGDFDYSGTVDIDDFGILASNFNQNANGLAARGAAVPEPASIGLIGLAMGLAARRRRA